MEIQQKEYHELSNVFPLLEGPEFDALVADIKAYGLENPIVLYDGKILDGRNRFRACNEAEVVAKFTLFDGADPKLFVLRQNVLRRNLTKSQKAVYAVEYILPDIEAEGLKRKGDVVRSTERAGEVVGVGNSYVANAKKIKKHAPEVFELLRVGTGTVQLAVVCLKYLHLYGPKSHGTRAENVLAQFNKAVREGRSAADLDKEFSTQVKATETRKNGTTKTISAPHKGDDAITALRQAWQEMKVIEPEFMSDGTKGAYVNQWWTRLTDIIAEWDEKYELDDGADTPELLEYQERVKEQIQQADQKKQ